MKRLADSARFYLLCTRLQLRTRMTSRVDFLSQVITVFVKEGAQIALIWLVLQRFQALAGWGVWEVGVLYSLLAIARRFMEAFIGGATRLSFLVLYGRFDEMAMAPRSPLFVLNARSAPWRFFYNLSIVVILVFCAAQANVPLSALTVAVVLLSVLSGALVLYALSLIVGSLAFWLTDTAEIRRLLEEIVQYTRYPVHIYGAIIGTILTVVIPVAFVSYYPSAVLLGKVEDVLFTPALGYAAPAVAAALLALALQVWRAGIRRYSSTGFSLAGTGPEEE